MKLLARGARNEGGIKSSRIFINFPKDEFAPHQMSFGLIGHQQHCVLPARGYPKHQVRAREVARKTSDTDAGLTKVVFGGEGSTHVISYWQVRYEGLCSVSKFIPNRVPKKLAVNVYVEYKYLSCRFYLNFGARPRPPEESTPTRAGSELRGAH